MTLRQALEKILCMSYQIHPRQDLEKSLKEILTANLEDALKVLSISQGLHKERFKQARKALKKSRAILRLFKEVIESDKFEEEDLNLKEIARAFRDVRDAHVTEDVFQRFLKEVSVQGEKNTFSEIQSFLVSTSRQTVEKVFSDETSLRNALAQIKAAQERIPLIKVKGEVWGAVVAGVQHTYADCRDYSRVCLESKTPSDWIGWRKSVKYLRVELDFLNAFLSDEMKAWNRQLHDLSDLLGRNQDLLLITQEIEENQKVFKDEKALNGFLSISKEYRKNLRKIARKLGEKLFEQNPKGFARAVLEVSS